MREISLNARLAMNAAYTGDVPIVLVTINHPDLADPIRLSSDPTQRLSADPLEYGTVSNDEVYKFVLMAAILPDDREGSPLTASLAFDNVAADMAKVLRSVLSPASLDLALVFASDPNAVEELYQDLRAVKGGYDASRITLDISREAVTAEPWPAHRMTQNRFPGLYR
jgi:hypothetical protein